MEKRWRAKEKSICVCERERTEDRKRECARVRNKKRKSRSLMEICMRTSKRQKEPDIGRQRRKESARESEGSDRGESHMIERERSSVNVE